MSKPGYIVAQLGARMHYAVARILHAANRLDMLYTDLTVAKGWPRALAIVPSPLRPPGLQRLLARRPLGIPPAKITSFPGLGWQYARRLGRVKTADAQAQAYIWAGKTLCSNVISHGRTSAMGVYAFNSAALELFEHATTRGMQCILEQTSAAYETQEHIMREAARQFPRWTGSGHAPWQNEELVRRQHSEWNRADRIICPSQFVIDSIRDADGPAEKCTLVPYGVDPCSATPAPRRSSGPLRVLTVGAVCLPKGSPMVIDAARALGDSVVFRLVGEDRIPDGIRGTLPPNVSVAGIVPRSAISEEYEQADVFLLPSFSEGSATVCYEALAGGCPVICTPNTGSVVDDGVDGYIVPAGTTETIIARIDELRCNPDTLTRMSQAAVSKAANYTVDRYGERLLAAIDARMS